MHRDPTSIRWLAARAERVDTTLDPGPLGGWRPARSLGTSAVGPRSLAYHESGEPALAYRVDRRLISDRTRAADDAFFPGAFPAHPHILTPTQAHRDNAGDLWLFAPFIGSARGLLTLEQLASARDGGVIDRCEAAFTGVQLLGAAAAAHTQGFLHGVIDASQVLVHPRGSLLIELYGASHRLRDLPVATDADRARETRSIVTLVSRLAFGPSGSACQGALERWVAAGSADRGYPTAADALAALEATLPAISAESDARRSWLRELMGLAAWTITRR